MGTDQGRSGASGAEPEVVIGALTLRRQGPEPLLKIKPLGGELPPVGRPSRQIHWHRLRRIAASVVAAALLAAAAFIWWDRTTVHPGGPVEIGGGGSGLPLDVGEPTSFGAFILTNRGETPAVLEKIRVLGLTEGFEVLGVRTNPVPLRENVAFFIGALGFPPNDYPSDSLADRHVVPAAKARTAEGDPEEGLQLVVGARVSRNGVARARGVEVTYRVGPRRYRRTSETAMHICAPKEQFRVERCAMNDEPFADTAVEFDVPE